MSPRRGLLRSKEIDKNSALGSLVDMGVKSETLGTAEVGASMRSSVSGGRDDALSSALQSVAGGRLEALEEVWRLCGDDLYRLALWRTGSSADAEDAVQEVFLRLARGGRRLGTVRSPLAYLLRMAHNAAVDTRSRHHRETPWEDPELVVSEGLDAAIDGRTASRLLLQLPAGQREAVFLRQFVGLTFREIGAVCEVSLYTAASRHRLAIRRLRNLMGVHDEPR